MKNKEFVWYVYNSSFGWSQGTVNVERFNIFRNYSLNDDCHKYIKEYFENEICYNELTAKIDDRIRYYESGKCEYECCIGSWPESDKELKLKTNCYEQVKDNIEGLVDNLIKQYEREKRKTKNDKNGKIQRFKRTTK